METQPSVPSAESAAVARRLPFAHGVTAVFIAFLLAQLFGKLVSDIAHAVSGAPAADGGKLPAEIVVPSMLASEFALLLVALVTPLVAHLPVRESLDLRSHRPQVFVAAAVGTVMLGPLGDALMTQFSRFFPGYTLDVVPTLHELASRLPLVALWPTFALLPGIAEELLFRGVLQGAMRRGVTAVCVAGAAFALFHVDPVHVAGVLPLGLFLSWVAYRSSTLVTIFAHVANNSLAVFSIHAAVLDVGYGTGHALPVSWLIASLLVFAVAALVIVNGTRPPDAPGESATTVQTRF